MNYSVITINMRNVILYLVLLSFTISCEITDEDYDTYTIKNQTGKTLVVMAYDKYRYSDTILIGIYPSSISDSIHIPPLGQYSTKKRTGEDDEPNGYFKSDGVDSVIILFNNEKRIIYVCDKVISSACFESKNIMNWHKYSESTCEKNRGCDYVYNITKEDYIEAELIK